MLTSLDPIEAARQITRFDQSWAEQLGSPTTVTYGFRLWCPRPLVLGGTEVGVTFLRLSQDKMNATNEVMASYSDVANIRLELVKGDNNIAYTNKATILIATYADAEDGAAGFASLPGSRFAPSGDRSFSSEDGDFWFDRSDQQNGKIAPGGRDYHTFLHEIGHSLGLKHPGNYNAGPNTTFTYAEDAAYWEDSLQYTVMSYFAAAETGAKHTLGTVTYYALTPLMHDIAAMQRLYGVNHKTRNADTVYGFNSNADRKAFHLESDSDHSVFCIWDGGGEDTLDFSEYNVVQFINLEQGAFSDVGGLGDNVSIALGCFIENALGGKDDDTIYGNAKANELTGNNGDDLLRGFSGDDTLIGGVLRGEKYERGLETVDQLDGVDGNDVLWGGPWSNTLIGQQGNDKLNGNGLQPNQLYGDYTLNFYEASTYGVYDVFKRAIIPVNESSFASLVVTDGGVSEDQDIVFARDEGADTIRGAGSSGFLYGGGRNDLIIGFGGADVLSGGRGDDTIRAEGEGGGRNWLSGGPGQDRLVGGSSLDNYLLTDALDTVVERPDGGWDVVYFTTPNTILKIPNIEVYVYAGAKRYNITVNTDSKTSSLDLGGAGGVVTLFGPDAPEIRCGAGDDTIVFRGAGGPSGAIIKEFAPGIDRIDATAFHATGEAIDVSGTLFWRNGTHMYKFPGGRFAISTVTGAQTAEMQVKDLFSISGVQLTDIDW